ncbi:MAG: hypothetical protein ABH821_00865 [archaeon]
MSERIFTSVEEIEKPKRFVSQKVKINGTEFIVRRLAGSEKLPSKFKSLF